MAVNLSAIKDLLLPGLRGVEGKYEMIPSQYDKIFTKHESKMALERTAEMRFLGLAHGTYALFETPAGIVLLDRRAAHERIWFERLQDQFRARDTGKNYLALVVGAWPKKLKVPMSRPVMARNTTWSSG